MSPFMQAYARDLLHKKHDEAAAAAGDAGVLRVCLMGNTRPHRILGRLWELWERRDGWLVAWAVGECVM